MFCEIVAEIGDYMIQTLIKRDLWLPTKLILGDSDVWTAHLRIVAGQRLEHNLALAADFLDYLLCQFEHGELTRVAKVNWPREVIPCCHHTEHAINEVGDILEGTGLLAVTVDGEVFSAKSLYDEIRESP